MEPTMSTWILFVIASTAGEPKIEVAKYPTEATCRAAQRSVGIAMAAALNDAIEEPNADGFSYGPALNCIKQPQK